MTYSCFMVHLDLGVSNAALLQVTADMAERFGAGVIGVTACQPIQIFYGEGLGSAEMVEQDTAVVKVQEEEAQYRFRTALQGRVPRLQWSSTIGYMQLADCIADQARGADLVLLAPELKESLFDPSRRVDMGDLVMRLGRPVIVVPPAAQTLDLDHVVIGWKDTRETRRAVLDALPLLRQAGQVTVAEIVEDADDLIPARSRLGSIVTWLRGHGVVADFVAEPSSGSDAKRLEGLAAERQAGLMVMGAYGHSRMREWVLGGITRDTLRHPARCSFMSH